MIIPTTRPDPFPNVPPQVSFRLNTPTGQAHYVTVQAVVGVYALNGGRRFVGDLLVREAPIPPTAWVAKTVIPLARGSAVNAQTPGTRYQIDVVKRKSARAWPPGTVGSAQRRAGALQPRPGPAGFNRSAEIDVTRV